MNNIYSETHSYIPKSEKKEKYTASTNVTVFQFEKSSSCSICIKGEKLSQHVVTI